MSSLEDELIAPLITTIVSFLITIGCIFVFLCGYWLCGDIGSVRLGDGLPGAFDDSEQFRKEEEQALELMDDRSRESYLAAKHWIENHPPNSSNADITLGQYMTIQDQGVGAWEFPFDFGRHNLAVHNKTEVEFFDGLSSVQTNLPLPKQNEVYYWEVKIYDLPRDTHLAIGLTTKPYPLFRLPGMHKYSVAYESTGIRRLNQPFSAPKYGRPMLAGDVVGVGYRPRTGTVFFTHNGKRLEEVVQGMKVNLFPTIGANGPCNIVVNLGQAGFVFIEANVKKWGLAAAQGNMNPPPAYGDQRDSVLLVTQTRSPPRRPPSFSSVLSDGDMDGAIGMQPLPPPYPQAQSQAQSQARTQTRQNTANSRQSDEPAQSGESGQPGPSGVDTHPLAEEPDSSHTHSQESLDQLSRTESKVSTQTATTNSISVDSVGSAETPHESAPAVANTTRPSPHTRRRSHDNSTQSGKTRQALEAALAEAQQDGPWQSADATAPAREDD